MKVSLKSENGPRPSQQIHDLGRQSSDLGRGQAIFFNSGQLPSSDLEARGGNWPGRDLKMRRSQ